MVAVEKSMDAPNHRGTDSSGRGALAADPYFSRTVNKALQIIEILQATAGPMTLNEIAERLQVPKTSAFRLLETLESTGYLESAGRGHYSRPFGPFSVVPVRFVAQFLRAGMPSLHELSREVHETATLAALFPNRVEVIAVVESPRPLRMTNAVGLIAPPHTSSLGKVIAAFQPTGSREKLLRSYGLHALSARSRVRWDDLEREYLRIRGQGFAVDREETMPGGFASALPYAGSRVMWLPR